LDFYRCIAVQSEGWKPSFNLPQNDGIDFNTSAPDFTKKEVRDWFWNTMWNKSLNPSLGYPGDALWIDEFDEMGKAPVTMKFADGTTWMERRNYWFFLISKSLVQQGWDKSFKGTKRPSVWVRGMTAGAQRYATLWSGDINSTYEDMKTQVVGLQLAGISGFPFWGHDAGGFHLGESKDTPNDSMYRQWSMAFGSFTPFWKPHGIGKSRWPLDRSEEVQKEAKLYSELRYKLMPYMYTYARKANETGLPMARAMVIDYQHELLAWKSDLQYMWGKEFLVAPNCSDNSNVLVWLPKGTWYNFWNDEQIKGDRIIDFPAPVGKLPLFVKEGSIIPMANYALSTAAIKNDSLSIHVYPGKDAAFTLYEDDGISENYLNKNEK
jgi:alpha-D-xyloside xylohydrolase